MKISPNFKLRTIAGETIIVNQGTPDADLTRIISLNASARLLWEELSGKEFLTDEVSYILSTTYHIPMQQAQQDAAHWIAALKKCNIIID
jgi:hypothetical protein